MNDDRCVWIYTGKDGGRRGSACGRVEWEHCKAGWCDPVGLLHDVECKLYVGPRVSYPTRTRPGTRQRPMVHHPYHRSRAYGSSIPREVS